MRSKKLFGVFNIVDIILILLVIAVAAVGAKMFLGGGSSAETAAETIWQKTALWMMWT